MHGRKSFPGNLDFRQSSSRRSSFPRARGGRNHSGYARPDNAVRCELRSPVSAERVSKPLSECNWWTLPLSVSSGEGRRPWPCYANLPLLRSMKSMMVSRVLVLMFLSFAGCVCRADECASLIPEPGRKFVSDAHEWKILDLKDLPADD